MNKTSTISLEGALTIVCGQAQRELLLAALEGAGTECVLDLSAFDAFDSAGVQLLLAARRSLQRRGGSLSPQAPSAAVRQVLETYGLQSLLPRPPAV